MGTGERGRVAHRELLHQKRILNDPRVADPDLPVETDSRLRGLPTKGECCREQRAEHRHSESPCADCHGRKSDWRNRDTRNGCIRERGTVRGYENRTVGAIGPFVARKLIHFDRWARFGTRARPLPAIETSDTAGAVEGRTTTLCKGLSLVVRNWVFGRLSARRLRPSPLGLPTVLGAPSHRLTNRTPSRHALRCRVQMSTAASSNTTRRAAFESLKHQMRWWPDPERISPIWTAGSRSHRQRFADSGTLHAGAFTSPLSRTNQIEALGPSASRLRHASCSRPQS